MRTTWTSTASSSPTTIGCGSRCSRRGAVKPFLYWYDKPLADGQPAGKGEPVRMEGVFPPGDYHVRLSPTGLSDAEYQVSL